MSKWITALLGIFLYFTMACADASCQKTMRVAQISNENVNVWKTIIYPTKDCALKMHRHEYNRVVVALNNGTLKITNDKGKVHYLKLAQDSVYYLVKDVPAELHTDENVSLHPIKVVVIELKH